MNLRPRLSALEEEVVMDSAFNLSNDTSTSNQQDVKVLEGLLNEVGVETGSEYERCSNNERTACD